MNSKEFCTDIRTNKQSSPYSLQKTYRQLQESIKERLQALVMHHQLHKLKDQTCVTPQTEQNLKYIMQTHRQMQNFYSESLLSHQVSIQEQQQIKGIIKNYEQRIYELRSSLVNKQAEITYQTYEKKRSSLLKKQNITIFNNQLKLQKEIKKVLQQMKRLKVQIQALEHTIQFYQLEQPNKSATQTTNLSLSKCSQSLQGQFSKEKISLLQKDKNLSKIMIQLNLQNEKYKGLKTLQGSLKKEYEVIKQRHIESIKKYNKQTSDKKDCQNILDYMDKSFNIHEKQVQQDRNVVCIETKTTDCLFNQRDFNKQELKIKMDSKNRRMTLKQKRSRLTKQN